jgi:hypothetical protein
LKLLLKAFLKTLLKTRAGPGASWTWSKGDFWKTPKISEGFFYAPPKSNFVSVEPFCSGNIKKDSKREEGKRGKFVRSSRTRELFIETESRGILAECFAKDEEGLPVEFWLIRLEIGRGKEGSSKLERDAFSDPKHSRLMGAVKENRHFVKESKKANRSRGSIIFLEEGFSSNSLHGPLGEVNPNKAFFHESGPCFYCFRYFHRCPCLIRKEGR